MENPIRKPFFVEFYGLPGCGKSTISHLVATRLRDRGYMVDEPSYEIDRKCRPLFRKFKKLSIYFSWFVLHNNTFNKVNAIAKNNGYSGIAKIEQVSNVLQKVSVYQESGQNRVIIWDQGLLQASISLSLKGKIIAKDNLKVLQDILGSNVEILSVLISVEEKMALERMSQRLTNDSRVERLKDDYQKHEMMSRFQNEIDSIRENIAGIIINGTDDLEKEVEKIISIFDKVCECNSWQPNRTL